MNEYLNGQGNFFGNCNVGSVNSRLYLATQIWTSTPLFPFPTTVGPDSVKIHPSPLKFPSVNPTHSKHPISTD